MDREAETTPATQGGREEDNTEESAREAAEALAADEVEAAIAAGGDTAAQVLTPGKPKRTAKEIEGEKRVAQRVRQILAAEREAVDGYERKRKRAEEKGRREVAIRQHARKSAGAAPLTQSEKIQIFDASYREVVWTAREYERMYDRSSEIKHGADAEKIARQELGIADPKKKKKEGRPTPLRACASGNAPTSPSNKVPTGNGNNVQTGNGSAPTSPSNNVQTGNGRAPTSPSNNGQTGNGRAPTSPSNNVQMSNDK